ncbi:MAG: hypothetical protein OWT28_01980 [Firmicutes bacterium]|nr:hypothetical protein [Bacillota bacterium]
MRFVGRLRYIPMIMQAYADAQTEARLQRERKSMTADPETSFLSRPSNKVTRQSREDSRIRQQAQKTNIMSRAPKGRRTVKRPPQTAMDRRPPGTAEVSRLVRELRQTREQLKQLSTLREQVNALQQELSQVRGLQTHNDSVDTSTIRENEQESPIRERT